MLILAIRADSLTGLNGTRRYSGMHNEIAQAPQFDISSSTLEVRMS